MHDGIQRVRSIHCAAAVSSSAVAPRCCAAASVTALAGSGTPTAAACTRRAGARGRHLERAPPPRAPKRLQYRQHRSRDSDRFAVLVSAPQMSFASSAADGLAK